MTSRCILAVLLSASLSVGATTALAEEPAPAVFWEPLPGRAGASAGSTGSPYEPAWGARPSWYGWQILALDASSALLLAAAAGTESTQLGLSSVGGHLAGPPLLHLLAHDAPGRATVSILMRALLPVAGFLLGADSGRCDPEDWICIPTEAWIGYGAGMLAATVVDAALVSWR